MSERILYWGSGSVPCWKPMLVLAEKGLKFESKMISFSEKGHKGPEVMALNPRGQAPTFKDGDNVVNESNAICFYLEMKYPNEGKRLLPEDDMLKAKVLQKAFEAHENMQARMTLGIAHFNRRASEEEKSSERFQKQFKENKEALKQELQLWDDYLGKNGNGLFLVGDDFTLADVFFFPYLAFLWRMSLNLDQFKNIKKYFEAMRKRESVQSTWPPHWKEGDPQPDAQALVKDL